MKAGMRHPLMTTLAMLLLFGALDARAQTTGPDPDLRFIDEMIVHHQGAIDEARAVQQKAKRPEVKQLAIDIIRAQTAEIAQLREWRRAWFPNAPQPAAGDGSMAGMPHGRMPHGNMPMGGGSPGAMPSDPDLAFIEMMIPHHQDAVAMSREILKTTKRPEIQALARNIIRDQEREIAMMEGWRRSWGAR